MMLNTPSAKKYQYLTWATFGMLWLYVALRAFFVSPLHDEVATYFHFIETGKIWGEDVQLDANNHLLNSILGRISYKLFGEYFFLFRLPNVLCFALYFWGIQQLLYSLKPLTRYISVLSITSIPYVLEYFAYTRGYGISISCFVWVLVFAQKITVNYSIKTALGLYFFTFLAILSTISFLTTGCLAVLLSGVYFFRNIRKLQIYQLISISVLTILFLLACKPLVKLSMTMKATGALYYGSLDGLWDVTGKTLSRYVLFTDNESLCWVFMIFIGFLLVYQLIRLFSNNLWKLLQQPESIFAFFFFGLLSMIVFMAERLKINYPEDRVAMQLIPLFLLFVVTTFSKTTLGRNSSYLLLFFPVTLLFKLSFSTSVFTPDERLTTAFYTKVKQQLTSTSTLSGYPTMQLTWALHERTATFKNFMHLESVFQPTADIVIVKSALTPKNADLSNYRIIAEDKEAGYIAYKRKTFFQRKPLARIALEQTTETGEYLNLASFIPQENWEKRRLLISVKGTLHHKEQTDIESIVISSTLRNKEPFRYEAFDLRWHYGIRTEEIPFEMQHEFKELAPEEADFCIYLWNKRLQSMSLKNVVVYIYALEKQ